MGSVAGAVIGAHDMPMLFIGLTLPIGMAVAAPPPPVESRVAALSVGATVVRPPPAPLVTLRGGAAHLVAPAGARVSVDGGTLRRQADGSFQIEPTTGAAMRITITY